MENSELLRLHCFTPALPFSKNTIFVGAPSQERLWAPGFMTHDKHFCAPGLQRPPPLPLGILYRVLFFICISFVQKMRAKSSFQSVSLPLSQHCFFIVFDGKDVTCLLMKCIIVLIRLITKYFLLFKKKNTFVCTRFVFKVRPLWGRDTK